MTRFLSTGKDSSRGFTLVELLVVIAIIAVLATIILPGMGKIKTRAKMMKCQNNLKGLYAGMILYEQDYKSYPVGADARGKGFWDYMRNKPDTTASIFKNKKNDLFVCPVKGTQPTDIACDYRGPANPVSDAFEESDPIGADIANNHNARAEVKNPISVLYWGGYVNSVNASEDMTDIDNMLME